MKNTLPTPAPVKLPNNKPSTATVIAHRKSCSADGTGLSHFILMDRKVK